jgi:hypothetical protein
MNIISILAARSLTEVLVSLAANLFSIILYFCIGMLFLFGLFVQLAKIYDWLFSKDGEKFMPEPVPTFLFFWWGAFIVIPLIIWFKNN